MNFIQEAIAFVLAGGPAMAALVICSVLVVTIVFERLFFFGSQHGDSRGLLHKVAEHITSDDYGGAMTLCTRSKGMLPRVLSAGLVRGRMTRTDVTEALQVSLLENAYALEQNLSIIGTIAVIAPFVGLFGTVLGIIRAFQDIALKGNAAPAVVAAGVSEALVTTAAGLFVAILSVVAFNYFKTRAKAYNEELTVSANILAEMLHFHNSGVPIVPVKAL